MRMKLTVGQLRSILQDVPDNTPVVTHGEDHSYITIGYSGVVKAECLHGDYYEYYNDENIRESGEVIELFLVSDM